MLKAMINARAIGVAMAVIVLGLVLSCGGGSRKAANVLPSLGGTSTSSGNIDRTASVPESEIAKLDPVVQQLYGDPGWHGPPTPQAPTTPVPPPPAFNIEDIIAQVGSLEPVERVSEPVVTEKGTSFTYPPPPPDYFPSKGEYRSTDYNPPTIPTPPWGWDVATDTDYLEDRINLVSELSELEVSFVQRGESRANQFNRGYASGGDSLAAVFQAWVLGTDHGEWSYPAHQTSQTVMAAAYWLQGFPYLLEQRPATVKRFNQLDAMAWYDVLIAPMANAGAPIMSTGTGTENETYAKYQPFTFDATKLVYGDEAWIVELTASENDDIQDLIDEQAAVGPVATYPIFGAIFQRWADDVWNVGVDDPWMGRLGWPLVRWMFIDRGGRLLTGPKGQYYQYGQYFEKGFMWWLDYLSPTTPDEMYIYMYDEDSTLESGGEYTQDPAVVRYGMGGPLGCVVFANPLIANVGDPVYLKAFPYGGPLDNANGFDDDWFLWNFRDGNITPSSIQFPIHEYYVEAVYTPRVMFTIDYDGDGNPDGGTAGYKVFADAPEITVGHLSAGGGGAAKIVIVEETNPYSGLSSADAWAEDLDALGIAYDRMLESEVTNASVVADYLLTIWTFPYDQYTAQILQPNQYQIFYDICQSNNQNLLINWSRPYYYYNWYTSYTFPNFLGSSYYFYPYYFRYYDPGQTYGLNVTGMPLGSGPGGTIASIKWQPDGIYGSYVGYMWYSYAMSGVTKLAEGPVYYYWVSWMRDANAGGDNGIVCWFGLNWDRIASTVPAGPGRTGVLQNLLNQINPELLVGGGGGSDDVAPWDGPVDIADVYAWLYAADGSEIAGGDGDTALDRAIVSVTTGSGPQQIWFECVARAAAGIDLVYEWEFEPSAGFGIWTKYTSHSYTGGIDPDGEGPLDVGDPFPVNVRVYDSTYTYGTAPPESRDIDSVLVEVHGPLPVDISDDGTVIEGSYQPDEVTGDVTVELNYKIEFGDPPYDSVWVDYDYDFISFNDLVEVTPTPGEGSHSYDLVIPDAESREYYIAIRVYNAGAPNAMDTYAWLDPVKVGAPVVLIRDDITTGAYDALAGDLDTIGLGYTEVNASSLTASDIEGAELVIWHGKDNATSYYPSRITASLKQIFKDYWDAGGNTIMIIPYEYYYYLGGSYDNTWLQQYWDISGSYPYAYLFTRSSYYSYYYNNCRTYNGAYSGPGGTCDYINYNKSPHPERLSYLYNLYNRVPSNRRLIQAGIYTYYLRSWYLDTTGATGGGRNVVYGSTWHSTNDSSMTGTRSGLLRNLVEVANPDLM